VFDIPLLVFILYVVLFAIAPAIVRFVPNKKAAASSRADARSRQRRCYCGPSLDLTATV
jgi:hypothetical protein